MLKKNHNIEIIVNNETVELYDQDKLNLRMNAVLYRPEEMLSKTGEYSFSFELPATPKNNRIFNYANNLSKLNKFNQLYSTQVVVDGMTIFNGTLRITDASEKKYKCNLVQVKVAKVEDIFKEATMNELVWKVDFDGTSTINTINETDNGEFYFPLVCYGAFQKEPYAVYGKEVNMYTDLLQIDSWNRWYWESFHPSFNMLGLMRKMFAQKGYTLSGDVFNDSVLSNIYLSEYIDSSQDPIYNLNKDSIGKLRVQGRFRPAQYRQAAQSTEGEGRGRGRRAGGVTTEATYTKAVSIIEDLDFPKGRIIQTEDEYDFSKAYVYDVFATPASLTDATATHYQPVNTNNYIYRRKKDSTSGFIQIPATGLYTIEMECSVDVARCYTNSNYTYSYQKPKSDGALRDPQVIYEEIQLDSAHKTFEWMPVEVQLVRNTDECELIWTAEDNGLGCLCQYPHETNSNTLMGGDSEYIKTDSERWSHLPAAGDRYFVDKGTTVAYDPSVNEGFICGFSTQNKSASVMKNGRSWNPSVTAFNQTHYRQSGYKKAVYTSPGYNIEFTDKNSNTLQCPNADFWTQSDTYGSGKVTCVVELNKNDLIYLKVLTKGLYQLKATRQVGSATSEWGTYDPEITYDITITPYTPDIDRYINSDIYYLPNDEQKESGWGTKLNLGNFLHKSEKMSDFVNNVIKTFNLSYSQEGFNVFLNKNKKDFNLTKSVVDIDNRVNSSEIESNIIDYPTSFRVNFNISDDEAGAYRSIDTLEHQSANNWKDYIDTGSDKIPMNTLDETHDESVDSKFSYTWYEGFTYLEYNRNTGEDTGDEIPLRLPLIAKDENFIVQSDDAMRVDGLSLKQRMWFRQPVEDFTLELWNREEIKVSVPTDIYEGVILNFKKGQNTLLDKYFNILARSDSNYLSLECYLTPDEFIALKNNAYVKVDSDLYIVSEITGYDPYKKKKTELKLIKKV